ncbi:unnamed protein product [Acanthoscelides obtectus]|uniref:Uncharacterized protein n=1 Tax=Acanthoscelides obtectus TaxID=200917 RepID=A0A9P0LCV7_ACAOB|nr:unnamed protein product [Acanthoscelides obtectus]CAK1680621.1 hypothetical protein AOBTE_LOCUS32809 [Acanthoscelides obtectus]
MKDEHFLLFQEYLRCTLQTTAKVFTKQQTSLRRPLKVGQWHTIILSLYQTVTKIYTERKNNV